MKIEQILEKQFKKLVPYKPLTAPEIEAIKQSFGKWLQQERKEEVIKYPKISCRVTIDRIFDELLEKLNEKKEKKPKVIILDNNSLSIACYMVEFGDKVFDKKEKQPT